MQNLPRSFVAYMMAGITARYDLWIAQCSTMQSTWACKVLINATNWRFRALWHVTQSSMACYGSMQSPSAGLGPVWPEGRTFCKIETRLRSEHWTGWQRFVTDCLEVKARAMGTEATE